MLYFLFSCKKEIKQLKLNYTLKQPPLVRENRLYQADWLLRFYQFKVDEIVDDQSPNLDLEIDPKLMLSG